MKTPPATPVDPTLQSSWISNGSAAGISSRKPASGSTPNPGAAEASSSSYLSRKARRFSTLKKQKKPSGLIQHLFGGASHDEDGENVRDPAPSDSHDDSEEAVASGGGCMTFALSEAMSSLRLDEEADVRRTIQKSMEEAQESMLDAKSLVMEVVCSTLEQQQETRSDVLSKEGGTDQERSTSPRLPPLQHPKYALASFSEESNRNESPPKSPPRGTATEQESRSSAVEGRAACVAENAEAESNPDGDAWEIHQLSGSWDNPVPLPRVVPDPPVENQVEKHVESIADALKRVFMASSVPSSLAEPLQSKAAMPAVPTSLSSTPSLALVASSVEVESKVRTVLPNSSMPLPSSPAAVPVLHTVATSPPTFLAPMEGVPLRIESSDADAPASGLIASNERAVGVEEDAAIAHSDWGEAHDETQKRRLDELRDEHEKAILTLHTQLHELQQDKLALLEENQATMQQRVDEEIVKAKSQWQQEMLEKQAISLQERIIKEVELAKQQWDRENSARQRSLQDELEINKKQWELEMIENPTSWVNERIQAEIEASKRQLEADYATAQQELVRQQVENARKQWEQEISTREEARIQREVELAVSESRSHEQVAKEELESEIQRLQRKINEQKDQTLMAKQLAKQHQLEMERMEAKLTELSCKSDQVAKLQQQVVDLQRERDDKLAVAKKQNEADLAMLQLKLAEKTKELEHATQSKVQLEKDREQQVAHIRKMQGVLGRALSPSKGALSPSNRGAANSPTSGGSSAAATSSTNNIESNLPAELSKAREEIAKLKFAVEEVTSSKKAVEEALQHEIDSLRQQMSEAKVMDSVEIETLKMKLESATESKHAELEASSQLIQSLQAELKQNQASPDQIDLKCRLQSLEQEKASEIESLTTQLTEVRKQLAAKERESSSTSLSPPRISSPEPLTKAKQELASLRREIENLKKTKDFEIAELQRQIRTQTETLGEKRSVEGSPARRVGTPGRSTPSRIPTPTRRRESGGPEALERMLHEREKEVLRHHVGVLEDQVQRMNCEHEKALEDLRKNSESELARIKREMENRIEKHLEAERELKDTLATVDSVDKEELLERIERLEAERRADRSGGLREVQKKEELLQRILVLEKREKELMKEQEAAMQDVRNQSEIEVRRLQNEIEKQRQESLEKERTLERAISETESFEKEDLLQKVDKLESQLESERSGTVLIKMKVASLEKEAKAVEKAHQEEIEELRFALDTESKNLAEATQKLASLEVSMKTATDQCRAYQEQVRALEIKLAEEKDHDQEELNTLRVKYSEELDRHRRHAAEQIVKVERNAANKISHLEKEVEVLRKDKERTSRLKMISPEDEEALRKSLSTANEQLELEKSRCKEALATLSREHMERYQLLKQEHEAKILQIEARHEREKEDVILKFAETDSDYQTKLSELSKSTSEKDAIITALGSQLAEAHVRLKKGEDSVRHLTEKLEQSQKELSQACGEIGRLKHELQALSEKHEAFIKEAEAAKEEACEEARDEMIERAEIQFKQANELYVKLKKQYDICKKKVATLEAELKKSKHALEEQGSSQTNYEAQLSSLKSEKTKIEEEAARKGKEYRTEMERLLQAAEDFEKKYKAAEHTSRHAYKKLAAVNAEKEKLQKECDEVKSVCEELMAMVEGQHRQHEC